MTAEGYRYLLDANVVSEFARNPQGPITRRIARVGETRVCTSIVVACEVRCGAAKRRSARLSAHLEQVLAVLPILPLEPGVDGHYGDIRADLERKGTPTGANDPSVAAQTRPRRCGSLPEAIAAGTASSGW